MGAVESTPEGRAPPSWMSGGSRPALRFFVVALCRPSALFLTLVGVLCLHGQLLHELQDERDDGEQAR